MLLLGGRIPMFSIRHSGAIARARSGPHLLDAAEDEVHTLLDLSVLIAMTFFTPRSIAALIAFSAPANVRPHGLDEVVLESRRLLQRCRVDDDIDAVHGGCEPPLAAHVADEPCPASPRVCHCRVLHRAA